MSERHGVAFVEAKKVRAAIEAFTRNNVICEKAINGAIDIIISSYEPTWWQEMTGKWDRMLRAEKVYYLKNHKYEYWKWFEKISQTTGTLTFDEVEAYMYRTNVRLCKELRELYDVSHLGDLEVGHEYAEFINKWSGNET